MQDKKVLKSHIGEGFHLPLFFFVLAIVIWVLECLHGPTYDASECSWAWVAIV